MGQTLHIFDSDEPDANLIGVVMFERDSRARITIIHIALHERCREIFEEEGLNITALVIKKLFSIFKLIKGVERVRIYYINKEVKIDAFQLNGNYHK
ncbi:MAG: hypothetical protein U5K69_18965 [Balneolaceae bacterium]|nr:hypothetical protein [Balneolaceae bacterium]